MSGPIGSIAWPMPWPVWRQPTRYGRLAVVTPPTVEPVDLDEAKAHLRVDHCGDDEQIGTMISAARELIEHASQHAMVQRTVAYSLDRPQLRMCELAWAPFLSIAADGIKYLDNTGALQTMDSTLYRIDSSSDRLPARVILKPTKSWPDILCEPSSLIATYVLGYPGTDKGVAKTPQALKAAVKLVLADLYEHREANMEGQLYVNLAVDALLAPFKTVGI